MIELGIIFIIVTVVLILGFSLLHLNKTASSNDSQTKKFANTDFIPTQMFLDTTSDTGIAINESSKSLCLIQSSTLPPQFVHFSDIVASFVMKNDDILQKTLRTAPQEVADLAKEARKKIGNDDENGWGSPTSDSQADSQAQKINLTIVIQHQSNPIYTVNFLDMDTKEDGIIYGKALVSAKHWHHLVSDLINQANTWNQTSETSNIQKPNQSPPHSVADELIKLNELLTSKVITQSDFDAQKEKLLAHH